MVDVHGKHGSGEVLPGSDAPQPAGSEQAGPAGPELRALIDSSPLAIVSLDRDFRVLTWSKAAERLFGYAAAETVGHRFPLVPEDQWTAFEARFHRLLAGEHQREASVQYRC